MIRRRSLSKSEKTEFAKKIPYGRDEMGMNVCYPVVGPCSNAEIMAMGGDFEANLRTLRDIGFEAVELMIGDPARIDVKRLRAQLDACGMKIAVVGVTPMVVETGLVLAHADANVRDRALSQAFAVVEFAAEFEAPFCIGRFRGNVEPDSSDNNRERACGAFRRICDRARELGTRVFIEPQGEASGNYINTVSDGLKWIETVGADNMSLILDLFHMSNNEPSVFGSIQRAANAGRIGFVHTCDSKRMMMGFGDHPVREFIGAILATGFDGYFSVEIKQRPDSKTAARMSFDFFNYLQKVVF